MKQGYVDAKGHSNRGGLYVLEGPDGVGKTTLARALGQTLSAKGVHCAVFAFPGSEPGTLGHHIHTLHHNPARYGISDIAATSLQLLHVAAHVESIQRRLRPTLTKGTTVVLDRYWWSTWVYGVAAGVRECVLDGMIAVELKEWGEIVPDRIFLIHRDAPLRQDLDEVAFRRLRALYSGLAETSGSERVYVLRGRRSVDDEVAEMLDVLGYA